MSRTIARLVMAATLIVTMHVAAVPAQAAVCDGSSTSLGDGGFEVPGAPDGGIALPAPDEMPPWQTTDSNFEVWGDGFQGVPAGEGASFVELNANIPGTLYQDVITTPGETMHWSLLHHARIGIDVMHVLIGDANVADPVSDTGWNFTSPDLSDDTTAWGAHSGDYIVPDGQTCTRFAFRAVSSGAGSDSFGNLLDAVAFSIPVEPTPTIHITQPPTDTGATPPGRPSQRGPPRLGRPAGRS